MGLFCKGKVYKPMDEIDLSADSKESYHRVEIKVSRMNGLSVQIGAFILGLQIIGPIIIYILKRMNQVHKFLTFAELKEKPLFSPSQFPTEGYEEKVVKKVQSELSACEKVQVAMDCLPVYQQHDPAIFYRWTIQDFARAYSSGETTPLLVAQQFITFVRESSKPPHQMSLFITTDSNDIIKQAMASTSRYQKGEPISVLDGVLIAVKDEIDCKPYPTTGGSNWLHRVRNCTEDAFCVKNLRSCGAILVGKSNMHELGSGTSGINPHYGAVRNPYDPQKVSGGSSSGSAAVVSAGLCPVALGVDGAGSVRIPASLCGVVGFKPTFERLPTSGVIPLNWTVGMLGIFAGVSEDAMIVYAAISGNQTLVHPIHCRPQLNLPLLQHSRSIVNITLAKYPQWFSDCNDEVRKCSDYVLQKLNHSLGWKVVDVTLPEREEMLLAHYVTIAAECSTSLAADLDKLDVKELGCDTRVALNLYRSFSTKEYLNAQRIRQRQMHFHMEIFKRAEAIVTPTTAVTAYPIQTEALKHGELDYINAASLARYQLAGNFLGLPAITIPVGYDTSGMPIGLQFIGRPWSEATLLQMSFAVQSLCMQKYRKPKVFYDLLPRDTPV